MPYEGTLLVGLQKKKSKKLNNSVTQDPVYSARMQGMKLKRFALATVIRSKVA